MIRIVSWNMQGSGFGGSKWTTDVSRFFSQMDADLVCLQDCGSVPSTAQTPQIASLNSSFTSAGFTWNLGSQKKPVQVTHEQHERGKGEQHVKFRGSLDDCLRPAMEAFSILRGNPQKLDDKG